MNQAIMLIDVGFNACGVAIVRGGKIAQTHTIKCDKSHKKRGVRVSDADVEHCAFLARELKRIGDLYEISGVIAEMPHGGSLSSRAASCMGMAKATVAAFCELGGLPGEWVTPVQSKLAATGSKTASKAEVENAVRLYFSHTDKLTEHEADAMAAYIAAKDGTLVRLLEGARRLPA